MAGSIDFFASFFLFLEEFQLLKKGEYLKSDKISLIRVNLYTLLYTLYPHGLTALVVQQESQHAAVDLTAAAHTRQNRMQQQ